MRLLNVNSKKQLSMTSLSKLEKLFDKIPDQILKIKSESILSLINKFFIPWNIYLKNFDRHQTSTELNFRNFCRFNFLSKSFYCLHKIHCIVTFDSSPFQLKLDVDVFISNSEILIYTSLLSPFFQLDPIEQYHVDFVRHTEGYLPLIESIWTA